MALIHIIRDVPEYKGGAVEADIPEQDYPILNARGWRKADGKVKTDEVITPSKSAEKPAEKPVEKVEKVEKPLFKGGTK